MYLKRLDIQGFKTFAHRTVFEFRPGITAVVGPNGSGKSNIADAVRWVLGEQGYAALRSKRFEDLIFGGGARRAPAGFAEVSLTIDNSDRLLALPYGEVTITRRITRSGESEYLLNRSRVRLRDVQDAVAPLGGSYTIINQGLVDAALTLKPDERRRLFEDAASISLFQIRKAEAESRLRETNANVERAADILAELEPRLRSLKRQASLARTQRELTGELRGLLERHYILTRQIARRVLASAEAHQQALEEDLGRRRAAQTAVTAELRTMRDTLRTLREHLGTLHHQSSVLHTRAEATQRDLAVAAERLASLARRDEEAERSARDLAQRREELDHERAAILDRVTVAEQRLALAHAAVTDHEAALEGHEAEHRAFRQRLEAAQRDELAVQAGLSEARRRLDRLAEQRDRLHHEQAGQVTALATAEGELSARRHALAEAEMQLVATAEARAQAVEADEHARTGIETLRAERARIEESVAVCRRTVADLEARSETLARLQRSYAGAFAGVKAAMQWAESQQRADFVLVASILRTPADLETAIEVALGSRLQNIVVERWQDAEDAITALKQSGAGRATFLPLDTIRGRAGGIEGQERRVGNPEGRSERTAPLSTPTAAPVLGVAADLVDFDPQYAAVAWQLLGRTLVVRDLSAARDELRRFGSGWTIVTLAGEQVSSGGAITGGAQVKESGTLRRERELRELPAQIAAAKRAVDEELAAHVALDARYTAAEQALREAEAARRRIIREYETRREAENQARREAERAETALELQRRRHDQVATELAAIEAQAHALADEQGAIEQSAQETRKRLAALQAEEQARATADRAAQAELAEARATAGRIEGELRAERALLHAQDQQIARLEQQRAAMTQRISELGRERAGADQRIRALDGDHAALLAQIDELRVLIDPDEAKLAALDDARGDAEQREADLTTTLLEAESAHGRALVEAQRARDRLDALWERAAADDIDIEALPEEPEDENATASPENGEDLQSKIQNLKSKIQRLGMVNPLALEEYEQESAHATFLTMQLDDLRQAADSLRTLIAELDGAMQTRFETTFRAIAGEFEKCFARLFGGGQARLELTAGGDISANGNGAHPDGFDSLGVEIVVRPPGKRMQTLSLLSGGERALTAAALLFAILTVNPSPFCMLDEVDAALDEANVGRFRELLADLSQNTQFLLITHNRGTIEAADTIYGVSMGEDGSSKVLSLRLEDVEKELP